MLQVYGSGYQQIIERDTGQTISHQIFQRTLYNTSKPDAVSDVLHLAIYKASSLGDQHRLHSLVKHNG